MSNKVLDNLVALDGYIVSIKCALAKARNGSDAEDGYIIEKLQRFANRMGFDLVSMKLDKKTTTIMLHTIEYEYVDGEELDSMDEESIAYKISQGQDEGELQYGSTGKWKIVR
jgi:hypothetical protein